MEGWVNGIDEDMEPGKERIKAAKNCRIRFFYPHSGRAVMSRTHRYDERRQVRKFRKPK